ncbi:hypothetical protein MVEG_06559 [Podila verticillata NRRL 6337]|nr:hypothetical protein MVEG_06559 [Podila verticillata NRRL 6337]
MAHNFHRFVYTLPGQPGDVPEHNDGQDDTGLVDGVVDLPGAASATTTPPSSSSPVSGGHGPQQHDDSETSSSSTASGSQSAENTDPGEKDASRDPTKHA